MKLGMIARNGRALVAAGALLAGMTVLPAVQAHASTSALCSTVTWKTIGASSGSWQDPAANNINWSVKVQADYDHYDPTLYCGDLRVQGTVQHNTGSSTSAHVSITVDGISHSGSQKSVPAGNATVLTIGPYGGNCAKGYLSITSAGKTVQYAATDNGAAYCG